SAAPEEEDLAPRRRPSGGHGEVVVDREAGTVCVRDGARLDSGGLGKGLAADLVAEELVARGASGALGNLGGGLRAAGDPPRADGGERGARAAARVLEQLAALRDRLRSLLGAAPDDVSLVLHDSAIALAVAQPFLPVMRLATAPAGRRYLAGWYSSREIHVLA